MAVDVFSETAENFRIQQNFVSSVSQHYFAAKILSGKQMAMLR
jgi:hypothetical protein